METHDIHITTLGPSDLSEINAKIHILDAREDLGFNFPVAVVVPDTLSDNPDLIMTNLTPYTYNSGTIDDAVKDIKKMAIENQYSSFIRILASEYGNPIMIPLIPRPAGLYPGYLGKPIRDCDLSEAYKMIDAGYSTISKEDLEKYKDIEHQVINMIKHAKTFIADEYSREVDDKIIVTGYSATSKFANCFTALHPELVKIVIAGGTTGLGILPYKEMNGYVLDYPIGVADVPNFNLEEFRKVRQLYYIGTEDENDPSRPRCEYEKEKDEAGNIVYEIRSDGKKYPKNLKFQGNDVPVKNPDGTYKYVIGEGGHLIAPPDRYTSNQVEFIHKTYSPKVLERFLKQKDIYGREGIDATFIALPGDHRTVERLNPELLDMILEFYEESKIKLGNSTKKR